MAAASNCNSKSCLADEQTELIRTGDNIPFGVSACRRLVRRSCAVSLLFNPQQRLTNGIVANDLLDLRFRQKSLPRLDVLRVSHCQPRKQQARLPDRPVSKVLDIRLERP